MKHVAFGALTAMAIALGSPQLANSQSASGASDVTEPDLVSAKKLYRRECRGCHGPTGKGVSSYPRLVGHPEEYIVDRLTRYRAGEKFGPNTPLMAPRAKKLSDQDILNLAAFIVSLDEG